MLFLSRILNMPIIPALTENFLTFVYIFNFNNIKIIYEINIINIIFRKNY